MATEIGSAYLALYAKMPGVQKDIEGQLGSVDTDKAGAAAGDNYKKGFVSAAALGSAIGNIVANVAAQGAAAIGDLFGQAVQASDATDKFKKSLDFAGIGTKGIAAAQKATQAYADQTVYDLATIQNTTAQLASNGVPNYEKLTEAAGNFNSVAGGNQDTFKSVAMALTQTAGAGKLTTENFNQLSDAVPAAGGQLQKALQKAGAYTGNFRDAMANGQITAEEFNTAIMQLGTQPIAVEAAKSTDTFEGSVGNLQATIVGGLTNALNVVKPALTGLISVFSGFIANAQIFVPVLAGLAAGILTALMPAIIAATVATWQWTIAMLANPMTWIVLGIVALVAAIVWLAMNWDTVTKFLTDVWAGFMSWFGAVLDGFLGWWNGLWTNVGNFLVGVWNWIVAAATAYVNLLFSVVMAVGSAISGWWNGLWNGIVSFFTGVWQNIFNVIGTVQKVFGDVFNTIAGIVRGAFEGVVSVVKGAINGIIGAVNGVIDGINGVAGVIGGAIGVNLHVGHIPKLENGGVVSKSRGGTLAVIGEGRYDEAVVPLTPAFKNGMASGNGTGGDTHITVNEAVNSYATAMDVFRRLNMMGAV